MTKTAESAISFQTLPNGLRVVHEAMPWLSSLSFTLLVPIGATTDPKGYEGSATVMNDWLYRGAGNLDSRTLSETLDGLGVRRGGGAGKEYTTFSASLLADSFGDTLELYKAILLEPHFDASELENAKTLAKQELASLADSPTQQLFETLSKRFFKSDHGNSSYGTAEGLSALNADALKSDYYNRMGPNGAILSVAGGISWQEVMKHVERLFADWKGQTIDLPSVSIAASKQEHLTEQSAQTQIGMAYESLAPHQEGWYEHALASNILSGGMGSRLFAEVREKRGLVYSVAAVNRSLKNYGYTLAYAGTTPERADETLEVLATELKRISQGVESDELERSRTGLLSSLVMQGESSGARASALARDTFLLNAPREMQAIKDALISVDLEQLNTFLASRAAPDFMILSLGPNELKPLGVSA